jgi:hypothetical protein
MRRTGLVGLVAAAALLVFGTACTPPQAVGAPTEAVAEEVMPEDVMPEDVMPAE